MENTIVNKTMEKTKYNTKMLGLVTLYKPTPEQTVVNIKQFIDDIDALIIWDNSPLDSNLKDYIFNSLENVSSKIIWHGTGNNLCIAPAINFSWHYAQEHKYNMLLIMDQDSKWADFANYRREIDTYWRERDKWVFTPYIKGFDNWEITKSLHFRRVFINSGTVIPISILTAINGADEAFPLDALDHDLSYRILKANYQIVCITNCLLFHVIGNPRRSRILHMVTNDYGRERTYSKTKCHIMNYRKNRDIMTLNEKYTFFKRIFLSKFIRILLIENDKVGRLSMFFKGIRDGLSYKFTC